jgi:hypothetical protein
MRIESKSSETKENRNDTKVTFSKMEVMAIESVQLKIEK